MIIYQIHEALIEYILLLDIVLLLFLLLYKKSKTIYLKICIYTVLTSILFLSGYSIIYDIVTISSFFTSDKLVLIVFLIAIFLIANLKNFKIEAVKFVFSVIIILTFLVFCLLKVFLQPGVLISTELELKINSDDNFNIIYYLSFNQDKLKVIYKDHFFGKEKSRIFEAESSVRDSLIIVKKINDQYKYQLVSFDTLYSATVNIKDSNYKNDKNELMNGAIKRYQKTEYYNYLSLLLTIAFVGVVFVRSYRSLFSNKLS